MKYIFDCDHWGSSFSVPSKVVDKYIKLSDGDFVKVLLCILCSTERECDSAKLAEKSGLSENTVIDAVTHWVSLGVITTERSDMAKPAQVKAVSTPVSGPETKAEPVSKVEAVAPKRQSVSNKLCIRYKNSEILEKQQKNPNLAHLFDEIQTVLQRTINGTEQGELLALYEYYRFDAASILLAAEYCASLEKHSVAYLITVMRNWYEQNICTYPQIEQEIIRLSDIKKYENNVLKIFGQTAMPSKQQLEMIEKWRTMGFTVEMLEIAYNKCVDNTNKLNYKYIGTILSNWASKSIFTPEQVKHEDEKYHTSKKNKNTNKNANKQTSYNLDDFEEFAMNFDLEKSGKL